MEGSCRNAGRTKRDESEKAFTTEATEVAQRAQSFKPKYEGSALRLNEGTHPAM
jgi:hypothetical protein